MGMTGPALQVISQSREAETDRHAWKIILWAALSAAAGFLFVASFERWLLSFNSFYFWSLIVSAIVFWSFATLQVLFVKRIWKLALITLIESAVPLLAFWPNIYPAPSLVLLGGAGAAFILSFFAMHRGRSFALNSVELRFFDVAKVFLPRFVTAWLVFLSVLFYMNYFVWGYFSPKLQTAFLSGTVTAAAPILKIWVPGFALDISVNDFFQNVARAELSKGKYNPLGTSDKNFTVTFAQLSAKQQDELLSAATQSLEQAFTTRFGKFDPSESMLQFSDNLIATYAQDLIGRTGWLTPVLIAAAVFFVLKGFVALFYWLIAFIAFVIFKIAIVTGFAATTVESRSREFVLLP